jgi:hypothetical protein
MVHFAIIITNEIFGKTDEKIINFDALVVNLDTKCSLRGLVLNSEAEKWRYFQLCVFLSCSYSFYDPQYVT